MDPFQTHTGVAVPLRMTDVDTDVLFPARFCSGVSRTGFADALLADKRADPDFVLNRPEYRGATILIAGKNFGVGSSREMAVWALRDYGFRVVIAERFGDIFRGNCLNNGLLAVTLPRPDIERLWQIVEAAPGTLATADLRRREITAAEFRLGFEFDDHQRRRLLDGLDDIALSLRHLDAVEAYERTRRPALPTVPRTVAAP
ncbi:3-isopropylmalate dehydratase small subunit [Spirillospora sp. CA-255316]